MLRDARMRLGATIAEAAADTRINPAYLEAIEHERWELMPAPVYAKGFFRAYARYLGLPPDLIERLIPRNLPKPPDLEPVAGLRKRAAEAPLSLPALPSLRLPAFSLPKRARHTSPPRERATRVSAPETPPEPRAARVSSVARVSRGSVASRLPRPGAVRAVRLTPLATAGAVATGTLREAQRRLIALRGLDRRTAGIAAGGVAVLLVLILAAPWLLGGDEATPGMPGATGSTATSGSQVAGPEPAPGTARTALLFKEGEMPDLAGMTRRDAEATLTGLGLTYVVIEVANASVPAGTVYNHSPQAGKSVKRGDAVTLVIARAP
jgi:hypothetical protein